MNEKLFITFVILNIVNVIIQTIKSLATVKCGKTVASIVNAVAYGLYTVVVVYTVCDLPLWLKVVVVGVANLIGVYVVKLIEEKSRKDKLWKIEATFEKEYLDSIRYYCLVMSEDYIRNHFADIKGYANIIENRLDDDCTMESVIEDNRQVLKLAIAHKVNYVLIDENWVSPIKQYPNGNVVWQCPILR